MKKGDLYELIVRLYLRLNGYFQTGLILHSSDWGYNLTEIDTIAVRFPMHNQSEREVEFCKVISPSKTHIELVIAEVKSNAVKFNPPIQQHPQSDRSWNQILNWIGILQPQEIDQLISILKSNADSNVSDIRGFEFNSKLSKLLIKQIIFSFENEVSTQTPKQYISGIEVIDFIWNCLCPAQKRTNCSTKYPLNNWGIEFEQIVKYFKDRNENNLKKPTIEDLQKKFVEV